MKAKAIILAGYGINCDFETEHAFRAAGALPTRVHINDLIGGKVSLDDYNVLAIPGGFAYADDLGAGKVLANKIRCRLSGQFRKFIDDGKLVIGICNGFQVLIKLGILPGINMFTQEATLTFNDSGRFEDRWVDLKANGSRCVWTRGLDSISLPVRHGEGKLVMPEELMERLFDNGQVVLQYCNRDGLAASEYPANPNGSEKAIAGICDPSGRIFGMMPHPEGFIDPRQHPSKLRDGVTEGQGLRIIRNAVEFAESNL